MRAMLVGNTTSVSPSSTAMPGRNYKWASAKKYVMLTYLLASHAKEHVYRLAPGDGSFERSFTLLGRPLSSERCCKEETARDVSCGTLENEARHSNLQPKSQRLALQVIESDSTKSDVTSMPWIAIIVAVQPVMYTSGVGTDNQQ